MMLNCRSAKKLYCSVKAWGKELCWTGWVFQLVFAHMCHIRFSCHRKPSLFQFIDSKSLSPKSRRHRNFQIWNNNIPQKQVNRTSTYQWKILFRYAGSSWIWNSKWPEFNFSILDSMCKQSEWTQVSPFLQTKRNRPCILDWKKHVVPWCLLRS